MPECICCGCSALACEGWSVCCVFTVTVALCMQPSQPCSTSQANTEAIMGSHVFLITQAQIRGRGAAVAVCVPPGPSHVASNWTSISANPSAALTAFPPLFQTFTSALMSLPGLSITLSCSPFKYVTTGIFVSVVTYISYQKHQAVTVVFLKMCSCSWIIKTVVTLVCDHKRQGIFICPSREVRGQGELQNSVPESVRNQWFTQGHFSRMTMCHQRVWRVAQIAVNPKKYKQFLHIIYQCQNLLTNIVF